MSKSVSAITDLGLESAWLTAPGGSRARPAYSPNLEGRSHPAVCRPSFLVPQQRGGNGRTITPFCVGSRMAIRQSRGTTPFFSARNKGGLHVKGNYNRAGCYCSN